MIRNSSKLIYCNNPFQSFSNQSDCLHFFVDIKKRLITKKHKKYQGRLYHTKEGTAQ